MTEHAQQPARLHALTYGPPPPLPEPCSGSYICECLRCQHDRWERQRQGVRPTRGLPVKARAGLRDAA